MRLRVSAIAAMILLTALAACAAPPERIAYQGKLTDATGVPRDGTVQMQFAIFDSTTGGERLWGPETQSVQVSNGLFNIMLGSVTPLTSAVFEGGQTYLEVSVGGQAMSPRTQIVTVAFAFVADKVASVTPTNIADILRLIKTLPDADGDGYAKISAGGSDSDDTDASIHPGATEVCDGKDNDCDGEIDEEGATGCSTYYRDADHDGFGLTGDTKCLCGPKDDYTATQGGDCNDADAGIHPGATEVCNDKDDNCDGITDPEGCTGCVTYYYDNDGDGYGVPDNTKCLCAPAGKYSALQAGDCDDTDGSIHPGAAEICDGKDNDCNGKIDEEGAQGCTTYYYDVDRDGYGNSSNSKCLCGPSGSYTALVGGDCDDTDPTIHPNAIEACNGKDDDCDGMIDEEGALNCVTYYYDADGDGYGNSSLYKCLCSPSGRYAALQGGDCDDADPSINPGHPEVCGNGKDDDCDTQVDESGCVQQ